MRRTFHFNIIAINTFVGIVHCCFDFSSPYAFFSLSLSLVNFVLFIYLFSVGFVFVRHRRHPIKVHYYFSACLRFSSHCLNVVVIHECMDCYQHVIGSIGTRTWMCWFVGMILSLFSGVCVYLVTGANCCEHTDSSYERAKEQAHGVCNFNSCTRTRNSGKRTNKKTQQHRIKQFDA